MIDDKDIDKNHKIATSIKMTENLPSDLEKTDSQQNIDNFEINVIIADTLGETFESLSCFTDGVNFLNLSSNFAVNFIMEYEKIDVIFISRRISGIDEIIRKAGRKKASIYILGEDINYPPDNEQIREILENEKISRFKKSDKRCSKRALDYLKKLLGLNGSSRLKRNEKKETQPCAGIRSDTDHQQVSVTENEKLSSINKEDLSETPRVINEAKEKLPIKGMGLTKEKQNLSTGNKKEEVKNDVTRVPIRYSRNDKEKEFIAIKQKIIVFLKAKGGVGSTLLSLFLACHFKKLKTLLVDLNFCEGGSDLGYYLNIPKSPNMIVFIDGYNRNSMEDSIVKIKENLDILQAPPSYELSKKMDLQDIYSMVDIARRKYHLMIFDLPNQINEMYLGVLDIADLAVMVSDFTVGSIGRLISINKRFFYDDLERLLVLNRNSNGSGSYFINNYVEEFFHRDDVVMIDENELLKRRVDYCNFDFSQVREFSIFAERILERLKCE
jgi:MinD-like ATPase involved in chromosome partitioning or flagellar assembly